MTLSGKTAVITGAGSGIGRAAAVEAARRGMRVALVGRRLEPLEAAHACLHGTEHLVLTGDVTVPEARRRIRDAVAASWGQLDVLVNNAGLVAAGPLAETDDQSLCRLAATNIVAPLAMVREMLTLLAAASGRVVNVGSILGDVAYPVFAAYSASKFALRGGSDALRRELKGAGVGVTYVASRGARTAATRAIARYVAPLDMQLDSPDTIARTLWDAVARGKAVVYPGPAERAFVLAERLFPALIDRAIAAKFRKSGLPGAGPEAAKAVPTPVAAGDSKA